jgi:hypothetical protein
MAEGEEGWTWPTWGSGKGRSAEDRIEALQVDLEDTMEREYYKSYIVINECFYVTIEVVTKTSNMHHVTSLSYYLHSG